MTYSRFKELDFNHVWHPFTQSSTWFDDEPLIVERAEGMDLIDLEGRRYLDGVSSLWCNVHGHGVPELLGAIREQSERVCHSTLLGLSHTAILELTERLMAIVPAGLTRAFYADSGSTAVEAALRICLEWWQKQGSNAAQRKRFLVSLDTAYHGDTLGAVAVGFLPAFHASLKSQLPPVFRVAPPHLLRFFKGRTEQEAVEQSLSYVRKLFSERGGEIAAFIIEPIVQGAAGIWVHPPEFVSGVAELCREFDVLMIADEVATGFGKTGKMFACELAGVFPDVLVVGKGLSAGYLPISAAITTERIFRGFEGKPEELKTFFYGQTFAGNPLAAAVSSANLDLFRSTALLERMAPRIEYFATLLREQIAPLRHVDEVRRCGFMTGIELTAIPGARTPYPLEALAGSRITQAARRRGVIIRPLGNVIVLMPPLAAGERELERLVRTTAEAIDEALG